MPFFIIFLFLNHFCVLGEDLDFDVVVPFNTSIFGGLQLIKIRRRENCKQCNGCGLTDPSIARACPACDGSGIVTAIQQTPFGIFPSSQECGKCKGKGKHPDDSCRACKGKGHVMESKDISVRIPSGVETGMKLRIKGEGHCGDYGYPRGDLLVAVEVEQHECFRREGIDIHSSKGVNYLDAILGGNITVSTIDGETAVRLPPLTQPSQRIRLKGRGAMKIGTNIRGDAVVTMNIEIPTKVSYEEETLLRKLNQIRTAPTAE